MSSIPEHKVERYINKKNSDLRLLKYPFNKNDLLIHLRYELQRKCLQTHVFQLRNKTNRVSVFKYSKGTFLTCPGPSFNHKGN